MGIHHAALADVCETISATGYATDPGGIDFDAYEALIPDASQLGLVLRPMPPDCQ